MNILMMLPTEWIHEFLTNSLPPMWVSIIEMVLIAVGFLAFFAVAGLYLVLLERWIAAGYNCVEVLTE